MSEPLEFGLNGCVRTAVPGLGVILDGIADGGGGRGDGWLMVAELDTLGTIDGATDGELVATVVGAFAGDGPPPFVLLLDWAVDCSSC